MKPKISMDLQDFIGLYSIALQPQRQQTKLPYNDFLALEYV